MKKIRGIHTIMWIVVLGAFSAPITSHASESSQTSCTFSPSHLAAPLQGLDSIQSRLKQFDPNDPINVQMMECLASYFVSLERTMYGELNATCSGKQSDSSFFDREAYDWNDGHQDYLECASTHEKWQKALQKIENLLVDYWSVLQIPNIAKIHKKNIQALQKDKSPLLLEIVGDQRPWLIQGLDQFKDKEFPQLLLLVAQAYEGKIYLQRQMYLYDARISEKLEWFAYRKSEVNRDAEMLAQVFSAIQDHPLDLIKKDKNWIPRNQMEWEKVFAQSLKDWISPKMKVDLLTYATKMSLQEQLFDILNLVADANVKAYRTPNGNAVMRTTQGDKVGSFFVSFPNKLKKLLCGDCGQTIDVNGVNSIDRWLEEQMLTFKLLKTREPKEMSLDELLFQPWLDPLPLEADYQTYNEEKRTQGLQEYNKLIIPFNETCKQIHNEVLNGKYNPNTSESYYESTNNDWRDKSLEDRHIEETIKFFNSSPGTISNTLGSLWSNYQKHWDDIVATDVGKALVQDTEFQQEARFFGVMKNLENCVRNGEGILSLNSTQTYHHAQQSLIQAKGEVFHQTLNLHARLVQHQPVDLDQQLRRLVKEYPHTAVWYLMENPSEYSVSMIIQALNDQQSKDNIHEWRRAVPYLLMNMAYDASLISGGLGKIIQPKVAYSVIAGLGILQVSNIGYDSYLANKEENLFRKSLLSHPGGPWMQLFLDRSQANHEITEQTWTNVIRQVMASSAQMAWIKLTTTKNRVEIGGDGRISTAAEREIIKQKLLKRQDGIWLESRPTAPKIGGRTEVQATQPGVTIRSPGSGNDQEWLTTGSTSTVITPPKTTPPNGVKLSDQATKVQNVNSKQVSETGTTSDAPKALYSDPNPKPETIGDEPADGSITEPGLPIVIQEPESKTSFLQSLKNFFSPGNDGNTEAQPDPHPDEKPEEGHSTPSTTPEKKDDEDERNAPHQTPEHKNTNTSPLLTSRVIQWSETLTTPWNSIEPENDKASYVAWVRQTLNNLFYRDGNELSKVEKDILCSLIHDGLPPGQNLEGLFEDVLGKYEGKFDCGAFVAIAPRLSYTLISPGFEDVKQHTPLDDPELNEFGFDRKKGQLRPTHKKLETPPIILNQTKDNYDWSLPPVPYAVPKAYTQYQKNLWFGDRISDEDQQRLKSLQEEKEKSDEMALLSQAMSGLDPDGRVGELMKRWNRLCEQYGEGDARRPNKWLCDFAYRYVYGTGHKGLVGMSESNVGFGRSANGEHRDIIEVAQLIYNILKSSNFGVDPEVEKRLNMLVDKSQKIKNITKYITDRNMSDIHGEFESYYIENDPRTNLPPEISNANLRTFVALVSGLQDAKDLFNDKTIEKLITDLRTIFSPLGVSYYTDEGKFEFVRLHWDTQRLLVQIYLDFEKHRHDDPEEFERIRNLDRRALETFLTRHYPHIETQTTLQWVARLLDAGFFGPDHLPVQEKQSNIPSHRDMLRITSDQMEDAIRLLEDGGTYSPFLKNAIGQFARQKLSKPQEPYIHEDMDPELKKQAEDEYQNRLRQYNANAKLASAAIDLLEENHIHYVGIEDYKESLAQMPKDEIDRLLKSNGMKSSSYDRAIQVLLGAKEFDETSDFKPMNDLAGLNNIIGFYARCWFVSHYGLPISTDLHQEFVSENDPKKREWINRIAAFDDPIGFPARLWRIFDSIHQYESAHADYGDMDDVVEYLMASVFMTNSETLDMYKEMIVQGKVEAWVKLLETLNVNDMAKFRELERLTTFIFQLPLDKNGTKAKTLLVLNKYFRVVFGLNPNESTNAAQTLLNEIVSPIAHLNNRRNENIIRSLLDRWQLSFDSDVKTWIILLNETEKKVFNNFLTEIITNDPRKSSIDLNKLKSTEYDLLSKEREKINILKSLITLEEKGKGKGIVDVLEFINEKRLRARTQQIFDFHYLYTDGNSTVNLEKLNSDTLWLVYAILVENAQNPNDEAGIKERLEALTEYIHKNYPHRKDYEVKEWVELLQEKLADSTGRQPVNDQKSDKQSTNDHRGQVILSMIIPPANGSSQLNIKRVGNQTLNEAEEAVFKAVASPEFKLEKFKQIMNENGVFVADNVRYLTLTNGENLYIKSDFSKRGKNIASLEYAAYLLEKRLVPEYSLPAVLIDVNGIEMFVRQGAANVLKFNYDDGNGIRKNIDTETLKQVVASQWKKMGRSINDFSHADVLKLELPERIFLFDVLINDLDRSSVSNISIVNYPNPQNIYDFESLPIVLKPQPSEFRIFDASNAFNQRLSVFLTKTEQDYKDEEMGTILGIIQQYFPSVKRISSQSNFIKQVLSKNEDFVGELRTWNKDLIKEIGSYLTDKQLTILIENLETLLSLSSSVESPLSIKIENLGVIANDQDGESNILAELKKAGLTQEIIDGLPDAAKNGTVKKTKIWTDSKGQRYYIKYDNIALSESDDFLTADTEYGFYLIDRRLTHRYPPAILIKIGNRKFFIIKEIPDLMVHFRDVRGNESFVSRTRLNTMFDPHKDKHGENKPDSATEKSDYRGVFDFNVPIEILLLDLVTGNDDRAVDVHINLPNYALPNLTYDDSMLPIKIDPSYDDYRIYDANLSFSNLLFKDLENHTILRKFLQRYFYKDLGNISIRPFLLEQFEKGSNFMTELKKWEEDDIIDNLHRFISDDQLSVFIQNRELMIDLDYENERLRNQPQVPFIMQPSSPVNFQTQDKLYQWLNAVLAEYGQKTWIGTFESETEIENRTIHLTIDPLHEFSINEYVNDASDPGSDRPDFEFGCNFSVHDDNILYVEPKFSLVGKEAQSLFDQQRSMEYMLWFLEQHSHFSAVVMESAWYEGVSAEYGVWAQNKELRGMDDILAAKSTWLGKLLGEHGYIIDQVRDEQPNSEHRGRAVFVRFYKDLSIANQLYRGFSDIFLPIITLTNKNIVNLGQSLDVNEENLLQKILKVDFTKLRKLSNLDGVEQHSSTRILSMDGEDFYIKSSFDNNPSWTAQIAYRYYLLAKKFVPEFIDSAIFVQKGDQKYFIQKGAKNILRFNYDNGQEILRNLSGDFLDDVIFEQVGAEQALKMANTDILRITLPEKLFLFNVFVGNDDTSSLHNMVVVNYPQSDRIYTFDQLPIVLDPNPTDFRIYDGNIEISYSIDDSDKILEMIKDYFPNIKEVDSVKNFIKSLLLKHPEFIEALENLTPAMIEKDFGKYFTVHDLPNLLKNRSQFLTIANSGKPENQNLQRNRGRATFNNLFVEDVMPGNLEIDSEALRKATEKQFPSVEDIIRGKVEFVFDERVIYEMNQELRSDSKLSKQVESWIQDHLSPGDSIYAILKNDRISELINNKNSLPSESQGQYILIDWLSSYAQDPNVRQQAKEWMDHRTQIQNQIKTWLLEALQKYSSEGFPKVFKYNGPGELSQKITLEISGNAVKIQEVADHDQIQPFFFSFSYEVTAGRQIVVKPNFCLLQKDGLTYQHSHYFAGKDLLDFMFYYLEWVRGYEVRVIDSQWDRNDDPILSQNYAQFVQNFALGIGENAAAARTWAGSVYGRYGFYVVPESFTTGGGIVGNAWAWVKLSFVKDDKKIQNQELQKHTQFFQNRSLELFPLQNTPPLPNDGFLMTFQRLFSGLGYGQLDAVCVILQQTGMMPAVWESMKNGEVEKARQNVISAIEMDRRRKPPMEFEKGEILSRLRNDQVMNYPIYPNVPAWTLPLTAIEKELISKPAITVEGLVMDPNEMYGIGFERAFKENIIPVLKKLALVENEQVGVPHLADDYYALFHGQMKMLLAYRDLSIEDFNLLSPRPVFLVQSSKTPLMVHGGMKSRRWIMSHDIIHIGINEGNQYKDIFQNVPKAVHMDLKPDGIEYRDRKGVLEQIFKREIFYQSLLLKIGNYPKLKAAFQNIWFLTHETHRMRYYSDIIDFWSTSFLLSVSDFEWNMDIDMIIAESKEGDWGSTLPDKEDYLQVIRIIREQAREYRNFLP